MRDGMDGGEGRRGKEGRRDGGVALPLSVARSLGRPPAAAVRGRLRPHKSQRDLSPALSRSPLVRPLACLTMMERPNWIGLLFLEGGGGGTSTRKSALSLALALDCLSTRLDFNFQIPL